MKTIPLLTLFTLVILTLNGCGGGSGGGENNTGEDPVSSDVSFTGVIDSNSIRSYIGALMLTVDHSSRIFNQAISPFDLDASPLLEPGTYTIPCGSSGNMNIVVQNQNRELSIEYNQCIDAGDEPEEINGNAEITLNGPGNDSHYYQDFNLIELRFSRGGKLIATLDGSIGMAIPDRLSKLFSGDSELNIIITNNLNIEIPYISGALKLSDFTYQFDYATPFGFASARDYSGTLDLGRLGTVHLETLKTQVGELYPGAITFNGKSSTTAAFQWTGQNIFERTLEILLYENPEDAFSTKGVRLAYLDMVENLANFFNPQINNPGRPRMVAFSDTKYMEATESATINSSRFFTDLDSTPLDFELDIFTTRGEKFSGSIDKWKYDSFTIRFDSYGSYQVRVIATDPNGNSSINTILTAIIEDTRDTDGDGVINELDNNDDNDAYPDYADAFPLDNKEHEDTDGDGIGNNADSDDDNDGVLDGNDLYPSNEGCSSPEDGAGPDCFINLLAEHQFKDKTAIDSEGVIYFPPVTVSSPANGTLIPRWDSETQNFLSPLTLIGDFNKDSIRGVVYSKYQHRLFVTNNEAEVIYFNLSNPLPTATTWLNKVTTGWVKIHTQGRYFIREHQSPTDELSIELYDENLTLLDTDVRLTRPEYYPFVTGEFASVRQQGTTIDSLSDELITFTNVNDWGFLSFEHVSPDGSLILYRYATLGRVLDITTGNVIKENIEIGSLFSRTHTAWLTSGVISLDQYRDNTSEFIFSLRRFDNEFQLSEEIILNHVPLYIINGEAVVDEGDPVFILGRDIGRTKIIITPIKVN